MSMHSLLKKSFKLKYIAIVGFVCIFGIAAVYGMVEATNTNEFCGTNCHEMDKEYVSWQHSAHKNVDCAECHEKPGLMGTIESKSQGTKELFLHVTGQVPENIKMEHPESIDCLRCHQDKVMNQEMAATYKDPHTAKHFENGMTCLTCHSGVVHDESVNMALPSRDRCYTCHLDAMGDLSKGGNK